MEFIKTNFLRLTDVSLSGCINPYSGKPFKTDDILGTIPFFDEVGFDSLEISGPETFYPVIKYLGENPFKRVERIKKYLKKTPSMMKISGIHLTGKNRCSNYIIEEFIKKSCDCGIDIFKLYDPLNLFSNMDCAINQIEKSKAELRGCLLIQDDFLEKDIKDLLNKALDFQKNGASSLCIEDSEGFVHPDKVFEIVKRVKKKVKIPVHFSAKNNGGLASISSFNAFESGAYSVETALSSFASPMDYSFPEFFWSMFEKKWKKFNIKTESLIDIKNTMDKLVHEKNRYSGDSLLPFSDPELVYYKVTKSVKNSLEDELKELGFEDKKKEALDLVNQIKKDLGSFPFVNPFDSMVVTQAVNNLIFDDDVNSYKIVSDQVKAHCLDVNGRLPEIVVKNFPKPLKKIRSIKKFDCVFSEEINFFENGINLSSEKIIELILPDIKNKKYDLDKYPEKTSNLQKFNVFINNNLYEVEVDIDDEFFNPVIYKKEAEVPKPQTKAFVEQDKEVETIEQEQKRKQEIKKEPVKEVEKSGPEKKDKILEGHEICNILAPMPGTVFSIEKQENEEVKPGDPLIVIEAMKMENPILSQKKGVVQNIFFKKGDTVSKNDLLMTLSF
ncbi:MAG: biotin/lipoyl-containing protein [Desulforegulaceae bacterium]|nr:biotin/lipoyl-containing protein [Desulforegulaceae bacterium]